ncbi:MAG TPA: menaquinol-cytochrome c reductase cytochrome b subunit, partial [Acidimicrobiales bacterium]
MTDVPEHLLKRSQERRAALGKPGAGGGGGDGGPEAAAGGGDSGDKIPPHLLARSAAAGGGGGGAAASAGAAPAAAATAVAAPPVARGPEGHTQRLLTVVKAGSIQDVKATPTDKVHVWPHLLVGEFVAALVLTAFLLVFSALVNAPFLAAANF